jgi:hypothetical protein
MDIQSSAYRHGLDDEQIRHAWEHALGFYAIDPDHDPPKGLYIGPDLAGNLLELLYLRLDDDELTIHAMALRPVFRTYLTGEDP